ncbi:hypothetical protein KCU93_g471, partial [Aureobasidium melanogenum]
MLSPPVPSPRVMSPPSQGFALFTCLWSLISKELDGQTTCWFVPDSDLEKDAQTIGRSHDLEMVTASSQPYQLCNQDVLESLHLSPRLTAKSFVERLPRRSVTSDGHLVAALQLENWLKSQESWGRFTLPVPCPLFSQTCTASSPYLSYFHFIYHPASKTAD